MARRYPAGPDVAAAYEVAQDRAAGQVIGWLAQHATTRVGPRRGQVAVPVDQFKPLPCKGEPYSVGRR